jgi:hypothetical protein
VTCAQTRMALGVYVLGALEPGERAEVERHLATCPGCRGELTELAPLPGLLGRLSLPEVPTAVPASAAADQPAAQPGPDLLDRVLHQAAAVRAAEAAPPAARRRWRWLVAAAAAVVLLAGGGIAVARHNTARPTTQPPAAVATDPTTHVILQASTSARGWGTSLDVQVRGAPPGQRCRLLAVDRDGHQEIAATWQATYAGRATVTGATAIPATGLVALQVVDDAGRALVNLPVAP